MRPTRDGRGRVTLDLSVRGRGPLRPVAAVALLAKRGRVNHEITTYLNEFVRVWNAAVPTFLARSPADVHALIVDQLR